MAVVNPAQNGATYGGGFGNARCHSHKAELVTILKNGVSIWAGAGSNIKYLCSEEQIDLVIDVSGGSTRFESEDPILLENGADEMLSKLVAPVLFEDPAVLRVDWPDYQEGPITLTKDWYESLVDCIADMKDQTIAVCCVGGHGRTGSMLAIMFAHLQEKYPHLLEKPVMGCPVEYVRDIYCDSAVESQNQIYYIEDVTGVKVTATCASRIGYNAQHNLPINYSNKAPAPPVQQPSKLAEEAADCITVYGNGNKRFDYPDGRSVFRNSKGEFLAAGRTDAIWALEERFGDPDEFDDLDDGKLPSWDANTKWYD